jgi:hypothetical protein
MNAALLALAAACLASSDEPPLATIPPAADVKRLPVGNPVSTPVTIPVAEPVQGPVTGLTTMPPAADGNTPRIVPMPAESYEPPPRRFGLLHGIFHRNKDSYSQEVPAPTSGSCNCGANSQTVAPPEHKRFGWLHGIFHGNQSNGGYVQQGDGQGVVISSEAPTSMPMVSGQP